MPIPLTPSQREALRSGPIAIRTLIDFYFDSGRYSFWDGDRHTEFDGTTYYAASEFGDISSISLGKDLGAEGIEVTLNGTALVETLPDQQSPGAIFSAVELENYQMRRAEVRFVFFHAETGDIILIYRRFAGFVDQFRQIEETRDGNFVSLLKGALESIARRYLVRGARTRSHDDQQDIWSGDTGFKFTANSTAKSGRLYWGRAAPAITTVSPTDRAPDIGRNIN